MENTIEEAKKFIDELKAKGIYYLGYEYVAEMLYRYADMVGKLHKPVVSGSLRTRNKIDKSNCPHHFVMKGGIFKCEKCNTTMGQWMMAEKKRLKA